MALTFLKMYLKEELDYVNPEGLKGVLSNDGRLIMVSFESAFDKRANTKVFYRTFLVNLIAYSEFIVSKEVKNNG